MKKVCSLLLAFSVLFACTPDKKPENIEIPEEASELKQEVDSAKAKTTEDGTHVQQTDSVDSIK